jgi:hypothetical protein
MRQVSPADQADDLCVVVNHGQLPDVGSFKQLPQLVDRGVQPCGNASRFSHIGGSGGNHVSRHGVLAVLQRTLAGGEALLPEVSAQGGSEKPRMRCGLSPVKFGNKLTKRHTGETGFPVFPLLKEKNAWSAQAPVCAPALALQ